MRCGIAGILLIILYVLIFRFSSQNGETSGELSMKVSETWVEVANGLTGKNWTEMIKLQMAEAYEVPIRKLAHFSEYAVMGVLVYLLWCGFREKLARIVIPWVFVSAALDELHQFFVPERDCNIRDVLLDTAGGIFGFLLISWIRHRRRKTEGNPV